MIDAEQIPPEVEEAGADIVRSYRKAGVTSDKIARAAFLAMLKAWPGAKDSGITMGKHSTRIYILPLTTEASDE